MLISKKKSVTGRLEDFVLPMRKTKLQSEISFDFELFGLICAEKGYKLAWLINQALKIRLVKHQDIEVEFVGNEKLLIANFLSETDHTSIRLLKNRSIQSEGAGPLYLLPELANFDYFILTRGFDEQFPEHFIRNNLQPVTQISFIQQLDIHKIKSRYNLLF